MTRRRPPCRIGWPHSMSPLKKLLTRIRPEYVGIDLVDKVVYEPGQVTQCDLWFPGRPIRSEDVPGLP